MIIVSGADNTGKTTLVKHLVEEFNLKELKRYHTLPPVDYDDWYHWVRNSLLSDDNLIADRFFIDEFVYGPIKRGKVYLSNPQETRLKSLIYVKKPLIILCETDIDTIEETYRNRDQYPELSEIPAVIDKFREVLQSFPFNFCPQTIYDFKWDDLSKLDELVNWFLILRGLK